MLGVLGSGGRDISLPFPRAGAPGIVSRTLRDQQLWQASEVFWATPKETICLWI